MFRVLIAFASLFSATTFASAQIETYKAPAAQVTGNVARTFNFDADQPWLNPLTNKVDMATIQYAGVTRSSDQLVEAANCESDALSHVCRYQENAPTGDWVTRVRLFPQEPLTGGSHRTQLNTYAIEANKRYILDLEFKLDEGWNTAMANGKGTIWQLKDVVKTCQKGNPVLGLNLYNDQLRFDISYPYNASIAQQWPVPVCWGNDQKLHPNDPVYVPFTASTKTVTPGQYHRVQLIFYADDTPTNAYITSGKGRITAFFDGQPWFEYVGPTLQPDWASPHQIGWGWYQWDGDPSATRTIYYRKHRLYEWK